MKSSKRIQTIKMRQMPNKTQWEVSLNPKKEYESACVGSHTLLCAMECQEGHVK